MPLTFVAHEHQKLRSVITLMFNNVRIYDKGKAVSLHAIEALVGEEV
jgi:hypothetical protein